MKLTNRTLKVFRNIIDTSDGNALDSLQTIIQSLNETTSKTFPVAFGLSTTPSIKEGRMSLKTVVTVYKSDDMSKLERYLINRSIKLGEVVSIDVDSDTSTTELIDNIESALSSIV